MIQPIRNNILVKPLKADMVSKGGIILSEAHIKDSNKVQVVAVGEGTKEKKNNLKVGDIGYRVMDWGTPIEENGERFYIMDASAILATE